MSDETQTSESRIWNVSVRALLAGSLVLTVCTMSGLGIEVKEPLYTMSALAIGFYFGQKKP